jgi:predicted PurR-regulated permease PerM
MTENSPQLSDLTARRFFLFLLIAATVLLGAVIRPIANSLIVAAVLAGTLWPLHQKLAKHMRNRRAPPPHCSSSAF